MELKMTLTVTTQEHETQKDVARLLREIGDTDEIAELYELVDDMLYYMNKTKTNTCERIISWN